MLWMCTRRYRGVRATGLSGVIPDVIRDPLVNKVLGSSPRMTARREVQEQVRDRGAAVLAMSTCAMRVISRRFAGPVGQRADPDYHRRIPDALSVGTQREAAIMAANVVKTGAVLLGLGPAHAVAICVGLGLSCNRGRVR